MDIKELKEKLQQHIAIHGVPSVKQDQEPDQDKYVKEIHSSVEFQEEYDAFLNSIQGERWLNYYLN